MGFFRKIAGFLGLSKDQIHEVVNPVRRRIALKKMVFLVKGLASLPRLSSIAPTLVLFSLFPLPATAAFRV
ncbi:hypothetical protein Lalb_Chr09g0323851 [Lupinus albus]|uniref:Uncharacterized protein n=1 Tax=Lupinus albus TaxID=3870 RepID=A0A6A4PZG4_LUPAL|nr:hypothetical protein Lalb_Chr09g0323851 [Lupinus albus]